jgi:hypothetical protein
MTVPGPPGYARSLSPLTRAWRSAVLGGFSALFSIRASCLQLTVVLKPVHLRRETLIVRAVLWRTRLEVSRDMRAQTLNPPGPVPYTRAQDDSKLTAAEKAATLGRVKQSDLYMFKKDHPIWQVRWPP